MLSRTASLALLAVVAALVLPVASFADGGTPPQQPTGDRLARIQARIARIEDRLAAAGRRLAAVQQRVDARCSSDTQPAPAAGGDQTGAPTLADRCAKAKERLQKVQDRIQQAQDRLDKVKQRLAAWLQSHGGGQGQAGSAGSSSTSSDAAALAALQGQLAGLKS